MYKGACEVNFHRLFYLNEGNMPIVTPKHKNESFEGLLRRFKRAVEKSDILKDLRKYEFYERPGDKRKRAKAAARKRQERITGEEKWIRLGTQPPRVKKEPEKKRYRSNNDD